MSNWLLRVMVFSLWVSAITSAAERPPNVQAWAWEQLGESGRREVLVVLAERADLVAATAGIDDRLGRRRAVLEALDATANRSQVGIRRLLAERRIQHRRFRTVNAILLAADRTLVTELATRPEVGRIVGNPSLRMAEPGPSPARDGGAGAVAATTWGVDRINAPAVWALGFDGQGIVIGGQDTGVRWTHEVVKEHYRGWDGATASHEFNWHDSIHTPAGANPCGADSIVPCDDHGHGTHTIGTAAGGNATEVLGVAPGARWIACRNMDEGVGTPARYLECFDFLLAPWAFGADPTTGDPSLGADVTNNSWTCPPSEGCDWDVLQDAVDAHRAAGVFTVASAGNAGSGCGSVSVPPATYASAFTIGASNGSDRLAGFSSRGPTPVETGALMKPEVVAPGVGVRSGVNGADDAYASWSGTSMAGPHVAGAVALLWSALPVLHSDLDRTEELLKRTARPLRTVIEGCGGDYAFGPNNSWGYGLIDVAQAVASVDLPAIEIVCDNGTDDDGDHYADCADDDCAGHPSCPELGNCLDFVDNDLDGKTDCADIDCAGDPLCPELGNCADGIDNDLDGDFDCDDRQCDVDPVCPGLSVGLAMSLTPSGPDPTVASAFDAGCRYPAWLLCPDSIVPGALPGRLVGAAATGTAWELSLYQHSAVGVVLFVREGLDIVYRQP